ILARLGLYLLWTPKSNLPKLLTRSKEPKIQKQTEKGRNREEDAEVKEFKKYSMLKP
ncbi:5470_t:CDS:2, partial [Gigaspora rosea]